MNIYGIGKPAPRVEDRRFLTGRGQYVDDIKLPRMCFGVALMSPYAHARILSIDTSMAAAAPGVICVLTGVDALADGLGGMPPLFMPDDMGGPKSYRTARHLLAREKVRCVGDRVAFVVAETVDQARDAMELIAVDYDPLEAVVALEDAIEDDAPLLYDDCPNNISCIVAFGDKEQTDAAIIAAPHVVSLRIENNRLTACSLEPRGAIGDYNPADGQYTLHTSSQNPHGVRQMLATTVFHEPETSFRVISPDVGGGFGMKADAYPEDGLVLWAARRCGRPVKWIATRSESLMGDNHGRDQVVYGEMALDNSGKILAIRSRSLHAFGAYAVSATVAPLVFSTRFIPSVYDVKAFFGVNQGVFTNTSPTGPYRGAGRPEATFLVERLLDEAAVKLGIDRVEIRRRNLITKESLPYATQTGFVYDSGDFNYLLDQCLKLSDWDNFDARRATSETKGKLRGRALSFFIEQAGVFNDEMSIRFDPSGMVTIVSGLHSHGQSHATVFAQLVAEWLGVPFESIRYVQGDTDKVPYGRGTYAARSSMIGGSALRLACDKIIERARTIAAHMLKTTAESLTFGDGKFIGTTDGASISMVEVAKMSYAKGGLPSSLGIGMQASATWATDPPNFPNGCHSCEVEIDPETGAVSVQRYNAVDDVGRVLNPMICEGQVQGGLAQGIGQALLEHVVYDLESGQLLSGSLMDYGMPRADDLPSFNLQLEEIPCTTNPIGVKGVGEAGTIGAPPTIINAVLDALRPYGVRDIAMPATSYRVWSALQQAQAEIA